jgi:hypothetical protein
MSNKPVFRVPVPLDEHTWVALTTDYKKHNDEPDYTFEDYLGEILGEEAQHISATGHARSAFYCFCNDPKCGFSVDIKQ